MKREVKRLRCAIYTRVSTEHGLEQDFNSLDAQREAAEAYIKSQAHAPSAGSPSHEALSPIFCATASTSAKSDTGARSVSPSIPRSLIVTCSKGCSRRFPPSIASPRGREDDPEPC